jgi:hypothetical protein
MPGGPAFDSTNIPRGLLEEIGFVHTDAGPGLPAVRVRADEGDHVIVEILAQKQEPKVQGISDLEVGRAAVFASKAAFSDLFEHPALLVIVEPGVVA